MQTLWPCVQTSFLIAVSGLDYPSAVMGMVIFELFPARVRIVIDYWWPWKTTTMDVYGYVKLKKMD